MLRVKDFLVLLFMLTLTLALSLGAFAAPPASGRADSVITLDGEWGFVTDPSGSLKVTDLASAKDVRWLGVPGSWQSQFADLRDYAGVAWYWRTLQLDALQPGQVALLRFGAVDYQASVFVNGHLAGSHEGGYLPFEFDVTSLLHDGDNQIAVRVIDPGAKPSQVEDIRYAEIPHGKQNWYVQTGGIWQPVELEFRPKVHLGAIHVTATAGGRFNLSVHLVNSPPAGVSPGMLTVEAKMLGPDGKLTWQGKQETDPNQGVLFFSGSLEDAKLWSPADPALYTMEVQISNGDASSCRFGFRTFETHGGKFYLNGKVIYLRGALDQAFYPQTIYTPPSLGYLVKEMRQAKALGLNLLRCHIKVPDPRYLEAADETGMLVWYEIPNWDQLTADSGRRALTTLRGMVERDWNHPSIAIVSLVNESWGVNLKQAGERGWLKDAYQKAKALVPGWLVDDNSACCQNFHLATDLADYHQYDAIPDHAADFDRVVGDFAARPGWLFSPHGDATPKGDEPLVLSEFGNWGLPFAPQDRPWWFARDFRGNRLTLPAEVENRFEQYQYNTLFPNLHALEAATQQQEFHSLRYEIASVRSHAPIQGYVITELTDVMWESNGLMDMWRQPKNFAGQLAAIQQDDAVLVRASKHNFFSGSQAEADVYFSHYSQQVLRGALVEWKVEGTAISGSFTLPDVPVGTAAKAGTIRFTVPQESSPSQRILDVQVTAGKKIAQNSLNLYFYPHEMPHLPPVINFYDPSGGLRRLEREMRSRDYFMGSGANMHPVMITSVFDNTVQKALASGGVAILLAGSAQTLSPSVEVVPRKGDLSGDWISNFAWVRKDQQPFKPVGFNTLLGFESEAVTPDAVVSGIPGKDFTNVLAGEFYGWIRSNVGTVVQARYGKGKLLICTFALETTYGTDPYATLLLDSLVDYAASGFTPTLDLTPKTH